jgi:DNA-binding beta-propeller fold protein YncE/mono/diheme cytochrome c family protein
MRSSLLAVVATLALVSAAGAQAPSYLLFESGPVRPIALTPGGGLLLVANAPDNRLEVFLVHADGSLLPNGAVTVGLEPVAVAARSDTEIWVVNHLSDSVSIVDLAANPPRVVRTLLVGDEPRDIVFAGPGRNRAFITTAHRGQHRTHPTITGAFPGGNGDPQLTTPGVARADVWVFDATNLGSTIGGTPLRVVELFGDTPRALAVSPNADTVYAAVFHSGNQTATVGEPVVCNGFAGRGPCPGDGLTSPNGLAGGQLPGGNPGPSVNHENVTAPEVGLIVQFDGPSGQWRDELGRNWSNGIRFFLPDRDVFAIDAVTLTETRHYDHVGTVLFNMAVHPVSGKVYVSNGDSQNLTRFEGAGVFGGSTVQGNLAQYGISVLSGASTVQPRHLNKHIDYGVTPAPPGTAEHSLATPLDMVFTANGSTVYVAAFGSSKIGVFQTATLEDDTFDPEVQSAQYIPVSGGGPAGLALAEAKNRLYVYNRFSNSVSIVDTAAGVELGSLPLQDPEPAHVVAGRPFLYDAAHTSSNGEASCSSCHIFGDLDSLAWDLGDPDGDVTDNPMSTTPAGFGGGSVNGGADQDEFHPMKGPMTTQTLRGLQNGGGMHWRGDRTDGFFGLDSPYLNGGTQDAGDEQLNFDNFVVAFPGLLGGATPATDPQLQDDMAAFTDFALELMLPPNPVANLDGTETTAQGAGRALYSGRTTDVITNCNGCHTLAPQNGYFGTGGQASFEGEPQTIKVPHLRNAYQKVGMFGVPGNAFVGNPDPSHRGNQVRGTGYLHDGSVDTLFSFLGVGLFQLNDTEQRNLEQFILAFPSDLAPIVGQQVTDTGAVDADVAGRITTFRQQAAAAFVSKELGGSVTACDLVVRGSSGGRPRGWLFQPASSTYTPDRSGDPQQSQAALDGIADGGQPLTYTCAPPGSGVRMALDRDRDGSRDGDELAASTDPANPGSKPGACNDGLDNDGDGQSDLADPSCTSAALNIENPQCRNGVDDDGDGQVDAADPHCSGASDDRERAGGSCGLGTELAFLLGGWWTLRRRAGRARRRT